MTPFFPTALPPGINLPIGHRYSRTRTCASEGSGQLDACGGRSRDRSLLSKNSLLRLKTKALRNRVWFRVLSRIERGLLDLTMKWVDRVKSTKLTHILGEILTKLLSAMNQSMERDFQRGRGLARVISSWALSWGNATARNWRSDIGFQRALGLGVLGL